MTVEASVIVEPEAVRFTVVVESFVIVEANSVLLAVTVTVED